MRRQLIRGSSTSDANDLGLIDAPASPTDVVPRNVHKMSVPSVIPPPSNAAGRSRLASFNLPLFTTVPKNVGFFSSHRRRGSMGKNVVQRRHAQKHGNTAPPDTVIDMELEDAPNTSEDLRSPADPSNPPVYLLINENIDDGIIETDASFPNQILEMTKKRASQSSGARVSFSEDNEPSKRSSLVTDLPGQHIHEISTPDDAATLQRTERGLLNLLDDFNAGRLRAFGTSGASAALRGVRDMQERLAGAHFDFYALQEKIGFDNPKLTSLSSPGWHSLMGGVRELSEAVQRLGTDAWRNDPQNGTASVGDGEQPDSASVT